MKYCSECGKELKEGAELCPHCGFTIHTNAQGTEQRTKYCRNCGTEVSQEMEFCPKCGRSINTRWLIEPKFRNALQIVIKIVLVFACLRAVFFAVCLTTCVLSTYNFESFFGLILKIADIDEAIEIINLIGWNYKIVFSVSAVVNALMLSWMIPMTVHYFKSIAKQEPLSLTYKICSLIFVSPVAGILMLVNDGKINQ